MKQAAPCRYCDKGFFLMLSVKACCNTRAAQNNAQFFIYIAKTLDSWDLGTIYSKAQW